MDDPFFDIDNIFKIVFVLLLIAGPILRAIFGAIRGGRRAPPAGRPAQGARSGIGLREFLEVMREEAERQQRGGRPAPEQPPQRERPAADKDLEWEEVSDEEVERQRALQERRAELRRQAEERRREREAREQRQRAEVAEQEHTVETVADRRLDSKLTDRHVESKVQGRELASALADRHLPELKSRFARRTNRKRSQGNASLTGALDGLTVKQLFLAQVVLGPPRAKSPHRPGGGV